VVVVDSVTASVPRAEIEGDIGDTTGGRQARLMSQAMRKWLNRRSQRCSYNWCGFDQLLEHHRVERPRIVGRPKARQPKELARFPLGQRSTYDTSIAACLGGHTAR
jgi:hypothetical protein